MLFHAINVRMRNNKCVGQFRSLTISLLDNGFNRPSFSLFSASSSRFAFSRLLFLVTQIESLNYSDETRYRLARRSFNRRISILTNWHSIDWKRKFRSSSPFQRFFPFHFQRIFFLSFYAYFLYLFEYSISSFAISTLFIVKRKYRFCSSLHYSHPDRQFPKSNVFRFTLSEKHFKRFSHFLGYSPVEK